MSVVNEFTMYLASFLIVLLTGAILYFKRAYTYWSRRNIPFLEPKFPLGNINYWIAKGISIGTPTKPWYEELKRQGHKFGGVYTVLRPHLVIVDPGYVKDILTADFQHFVNRGIYFNEKSDPLNANLFSHDTAQWRRLRVKLTPTFTSGKMKMMFQNVLECSDSWIEALEADADRKSPVDIYETAARFTTDVIGKTAFGIDCNSFMHTDAEFRKMGKKVFAPPKWIYFILFLTNTMPNLARKLGLSQSTGKMTEFFTRITRDAVTYREKNKIVRPDFLQLLIDMKSDMKDGPPLTMDEVVGQTFLFFVAGFETSSSTIQYCTYELSRNQEAQERARKEVLEVLSRHNGQVTYDAIMDMKYLGQCVDETLRLYPPVPTLNRMCTKDYKLEGTDVVIEEGTSILIPALGLQRDPEYYPDPLKWDPERFNDANKSQHNSGAYVPFGDGPRNCIGMRFGVMQVKIGLARLLKNFKITKSDRSQPPLEFEQCTFLLFPTKKVYVNLERLSC